MDTSTGRNPPEGPGEMVGRRPLPPGHFAPSTAARAEGGGRPCLLRRWRRGWEQRGQGEGGAEAGHVVGLRRRRAEG
ncbi:MAG TPA: hypothetical protein VKY90_10125, partial [Candidatus Dormibacteraeota bacterium]|nr:hypothetical protein [Candidatus Dormibacteraeota bacterium]